MRDWALTSVVCEPPDRYYDEVIGITWPLMEAYADHHRMAWRPKVITRAEYDDFAGIGCMTQLQGGVSQTQDELAGLHRNLSPLHHTSGPSGILGRISSAQFHARITTMSTFVDRSSW